MGSRGGRRIHRNICFCWEHGPSGSCWSSSWSPSSFQWRKWDFATVATCPEIHNSPAPEAGEIVESFFPVPHQKTQLAKTEPILMGHTTGDIVFLETLTHTWGLYGLWSKIHSVMVILKQKKFLIDLTSWPWKSVWHQPNHLTCCLFLIFSSFRPSVSPMVLYYIIL